MSSAHSRVFPKHLCTKLFVISIRYYEQTLHNNYEFVIQKYGLLYTYVQYRVKQRYLALVYNLIFKIMFAIIILRTACFVLAYVKKRASIS